MIKINKIDLHTHTIASDEGTTPEELIQEALKKNIWRYRLSWEKQTRNKTWKWKM